MLFVLGTPYSGKTSICQAICERTGWQYVDFTLDPGCLERLTGREEEYSPEDFVTDLRAMCARTSAQVLVIDEIEPVISRWRSKKQDDFFRGIGRSTRLRAGLVIVTRIRNVQDLTPLVPGPDHVFDIAAGANDD